MQTWTLKIMVGEFQLFPPTAESFGVSAQIGSGVVRDAVGDIT